MELGILDVLGFLSFKDARNKQPENKKELQVGQLIDVIVLKMSSNGRLCNLLVNSTQFANSAASVSRSFAMYLILIWPPQITELNSVTSIVPGMLVQSLVTAVSSTGINVQVLGFFEGTVDPFHLPPGPPEKSFKIGRKVKARVLYIIPSDPPRLALSLSDHVLKLVPRGVKVEGAANSVSLLQDAFPVGTILAAVKVVRVEAERGLLVEVQSHTEGFIHVSLSLHIHNAQLILTQISHVSDEHTPTLSSRSGPWKVGSTHTARVTGYHPFDGLLRLSMRPSILAQKFLQAVDLQVGELVKGTIKRLSDSGLVVNISGNLDGVVWPSHYADIALKHPSKRFKVGGKIKCRVR